MFLIYKEKRIILLKIKKRLYYLIIYIKTKAF
jgi:hypothetical protein